jgi:flagellar motor switch protein FliG
VSIWRREVALCERRFVRRQEKGLVVCAIKKKGKSRAIVMGLGGDVSGEIFDHLEKNRRR